MCNLLSCADDPVQRKGNHLDQREKLGLNHASRGQSNTRAPLPEPTDAYQKVEVCVNMSFLL